MQTTILGKLKLIVICACFFITQSFINIYKHIIHQIEAEYPFYRLISILIWFTDN